MNIKYIPTGMKNLSKATLMGLKHHAPTILTGIGIVGVCGAGVMACKATLKLPETTDRIATDMQNLKEAKEGGQPIYMDNEQIGVTEPMDEKMYSRELCKVYGHAAWEMTKLYGPSIFLGASSIASILAGKKILDARCASALNAVHMTEQLFEKYRSRVREELGEKKDEEFRYGIREVIEEQIVTDKNGNPKTDKNGVVKTATKKTKVIEQPDENDFHRLFAEESTHEWDRDSEYNADFLIRRQNIHNQILHSRGYITFNDILTDLGFPIMSWGWDYGYVNDGKSDVDYGILDHMGDLDPYNNVIWLTFPGVSYIRDKVYATQRVW